MPKSMNLSPRKWPVVFASWLGLILISCGLTVGAQQQVFVEVLTEATPFTLQGPSNTNNGEATTFVKDILTNAGVDNNIAYTPWRRSYQYALSKPNVLIYPIARTQQRENDFIWVGSIIPVSYFLFRLRSRTDIKLSQIEQARQFSIGVVDHHAHHEYLVSKGFSDLQIVNSSAQNLHKLLLGRIDLFPMSSGGLEPLCQQAQIDCKQIVPAIAFEDFSDGLYMAFSKGSDSNTVKKVKEAYEKMRSSPAYEELFSYRNSLARTVESGHLKAMTTSNENSDTEDPKN